MAPECIEVAGNAAGAKAIMALCDDTFLDQSKQLAHRINTVDLAGSPDFQDAFIEALNFPF